MTSSIQFETDLLFAIPLSNGTGYTWTLASRLGDMLEKAEERFGPRDRSYTILGLEFAPAPPQIWYPGGCRNIVIQITPDCATNRARAYYQLAHECIHLLAPTGGQNANNLEEGLATQFSRDYVYETLRIQINTALQSYERARSVVQNLLSANPEFIRNIRLSQPSISQITPDQISAEVPSVSQQDAEYLCQPFVRDA